VTAIATTPSVSDPLRDQLYWNTSIRREVVLRGAAPTDGFSAPQLEIARSGAMRNVTGDVLVDDSSTTVALAAATRLAGVPGFTLWRPAGAPRLRLLMTNRYADGWLGAGGAIRAWPLRQGRAVRVSFAVSLPRGRRATRLQLGRTTLLIRPGEVRHVSCDSASGPLDVAFASPDPTIDRELRRLSVRASEPRVEDVAARPGAAFCY
jgi:hypothetical protein